MPGVLRDDGILLLPKAKTALHIVINMWAVRQPEEMSGWICGIYVNEFTVTRGIIRNGVKQNMND